MRELGQGSGSRGEEESVSYQEQVKGEERKRLKGVA